MPEARIEAYRARAELALDARLPAAATLPARLHEAMRYAVLGGGKRVRPVLVYAAGEAVGAAPEGLDGPACALEFIHAYSLVHDDLPAMDDDDLRRGRPTCHRAFDEATAILAGDALQTLAFHVLAHDPSMTVPADTRLRMVELLAHAAGSRGMCGGQAIDMAAVGRELTLAELENMHIHKTGALIRAAVLLGALSQPGVADEELARLDRYAKCIGLAFQIHDDILDVVGDTATLGKRQGADQALDKPTYPALLGLDGARAHARALYDDAMHALEPFGERAAVLRALAAFIVERSH
ncbi:MAG TPA: (2E,6E)-farnesyl diphosphate synthase [Plasticicumulans sp.]|uniref:(2E,6E)-farnesyl diphosphate synthase n=1 Tax=Plasticicumulans sp. TaxID=2307179 RepID=UPI002C83F2C8|nr:farnesyl diphosphate synthase [Plasticicumulans sp.]HMW28254.1 (2E,6E)-farnesyl diphosphate synthase [Plasticicumulans sp.]HMW40852.1 (2E,6E)-farnesyl diphosphate synthase [Plasticicumulans sp.]HNG48099.1 (2E,6E)-farnesyl diphosphate synthase [Plasticicumulans sp.]HNI21988.1 (2E,6E)-farnesyl diphosphate synthase [Plasticicumulans sp.]HNJ06387.1 (2E,6E)-farnesyl diphosphate synthase [Plasticicumulans sp.]